MKNKNKGPVKYMTSFQYSKYLSIILNMVLFIYWYSSSLIEIQCILIFSKLETNLKYSIIKYVKY